MISSIFKLYHLWRGHYQCAGCKRWFAPHEVCPSNNGLLDYLYCAECWPRHAWSERVEVQIIPEDELREIQKSIREYQAEVFRKKYYVVPKTKP